ncbi:UNVERIFIED_CONTAM: hypothetical protein NCL1_60203 [Trichonephila clavipes]
MNMGKTKSPPQKKNNDGSISSKEDSLVADFKYNLRPRKRIINYSDVKNSKVVKKNPKLTESSVILKRDATKFKNNYIKLTICPLTDPTLSFGEKGGISPFFPPIPKDLIPKIKIPIDSMFSL